MWLETKEKEALLNLARATLNASFTGSADDVIDTFMAEQGKSAPILAQQLPCFVTLNKHGKLRGCIGCLITDQTLSENVHEYTQLAAFSDPRFPQLTPEEVPDSKIEITVLGPLQPLRDLKSIQVGKHGLCVKHSLKAGVLLAHVATDYGWSAEEFRRRTCEKAGLDPEKEADYEWSYFEETSFSEI